MEEQVLNEINKFISVFESEVEETIHWDFEELEGGFKINVDRVVYCDKINEIIKTVEKLTNSTLKTQVLVGSKHSFILEYN